MSQLHFESAARSDAARVLVTGANGQIGRRLVERLARADRAFAVRAVVRSESAAATLAALPAALRPEVVILDYRDGERLAQAARNCRYAVHLVGILKQSATSRYDDAHEASARTIADAAEAAGLRRVVYLSILGSDANSTNACLASKGRAEQILLAAKTPALILRVPMVVGPGDATANMIRREALARLLPLVAGGRSRTQPIYVGDVVEAIVAGLERGVAGLERGVAGLERGVAGLEQDGLDDRILDLAGPESLSQRELIERAARLYGRRPRVVSISRGVIGCIAGLAERFLANPPITKSALEVILADDDVDPEPARRQLGIELTPIDDMLRLCVGPRTARREAAPAAK